jgi:uncharacterized membrane protein
MKHNKLHRVLRIGFLVFLLSAVGLPLFVWAQSGELIQDEITIVQARVLEITDQKTESLPGTSISNTTQKIRVEIVEGDEAGKVVDVDNDYIKLKVGETFFLAHTTNSVDGRDYYSVSEPNRLPTLIFFVVLFVVLVFVFGGIQGVRGLVSLVGSMILILCVLLPGILAGYSPILVSVGVSALIIVLGSYVTHGFNKTTSSAVIGMIVTVVFTGALAYAAVHFSRLTGFGSEEVVYLNFDTRGSIDLVGLLLGGILIGLLGVLYDVAIGQAISVEELHRVAPHISRQTVFRRAIRIGREHIGALVNTLAIAYVGVSLPLLLLYIKSSAPLGLTLNQEMFATEIIRMMIGSIGLVVAVPITTAIAVWILIRREDGVRALTPEQIKKEQEAIEHMGEHAGHHH